MGMSKQTGSLLPYSHTKESKISKRGEDALGQDTRTTREVRLSLEHARARTYTSPRPYPSLFHFSFRVAYSADCFVSDPERGVLASGGSAFPLLDFFFPPTTFGSHETDGGDRGKRGGATVGLRGR